MPDPQAPSAELYEEELEEQLEGEALEPAGAPRRKRGGLWLLLLLVLGLCAGGGWFAWQQMGESAPAKADTDAPAGEEPGARRDAQYIPLDPPLVVNFAGGGKLRYLQVSLEVMTPDSGDKATLDRHVPAIRNALIALFSERDYEALLTRAGKEALRGEALEVIRAEMTALTGDPVAEDVYFTSFVMQ